MSVGQQARHEHRRRRRRRTAWAGDLLFAGAHRRLLAHSRAARRPGRPPTDASDDKNGCPIVLLTCLPISLRQMRRPAASRDCQYQRQRNSVWHMSPCARGTELNQTWSCLYQTSGMVGRCSTGSRRPPHVLAVHVSCNGGRPSDSGSTAIFPCGMQIFRHEHEGVAPCGPLLGSPTPHRLCAWRSYNLV
ncbi:hypothetical protein OH77DRAFT_917656 [Trametes cingulata]|nr:hypothetical protein OH77DRAFT_917656 [Trametes cingulata]